MAKVEEMLENLNGFGKYQKLRFTMLCLSGLLPPIASYIHSFIAASPKYSCGDYEYNSSLIFNGLSYYRSQVYREKCGLVMPNISLNNTLNIRGEKVCISWLYDKTYYKNTLTEQFDLVCDKAIWRSFMQSVYYSGVLIGSIFIGQMGKKHGQILALWLSLSLLVLGALSLCYVSYKTINYFTLLLGRFLIAIGSHGISINSYLLTMEFIDKKNKKYCALVFEFVFPLGQIVLVMSAYFLREWQQLIRIILVACLPFFIFVCLSDESWQYLNKKKDFNKIEMLLRKISKLNKTKFDDVVWKNLISKENQERKLSNISHFNLTKSNYLFISIIGLNWIVNNFIFHGIGLRSNDLGISPYESFALSAFIEIISSLFTFKLLRRNFRRTFYFIFMLISGFFSTTIFFSKSVILIVCSAMIAKFSIACSYAIIRLYSNEFFPESNRKSYISKCSIMARTGSVIAPFIIALGDIYSKQLPFLIFGFCCFCSALLTLALPRIKKSDLSTENKQEIDQQLIQNNWLDGQDICLEKMDNSEENIDLKIKESI